MTGDSGIRRLWPDPDGATLDETGVIDSYARPIVATLRVNFVSSLDGAVEVEGHSAGLSSPADKRVFGILRMLCDALLVGAGTLRTEGYRAVRLDPARRAWRRAHGLVECPTLVVVSNSLRLDPAAPAFADAPVRPVVLTHADAEPPAGLTEVADVIRHGGGTVDLAAGLAELRRRGHHQVLSEGGPVLFGALTAADLVDELCLTLSPLLAGPGAGRITAGPPRGDGPPVPRGMALTGVLTTDDGALLLRYVRQRGR
ncbi:pyrimidine reductase family protein [Plantactinospora sp. GCM10030261]|uniref:pyrimidine reductase family protein n=1 Tax=Plantactinospora sp. GCM10030261 TaxID=3273420 RepID=UPI0036168948